MNLQVTYDWDGLVRICRYLRGPQGCSWDRAQTPRTLTPYLLEETHELLAAMTDGDPPRMREELGDLLFLLAFVVTIVEEESDHGFADIAGGIIKKMIRRHPHVFAKPAPAVDPAGIKEQWEAIKRRESGRDSAPGDRLAPGAETLPALTEAYRVQEKAAHYGFDWPAVAPVLEKLDEEERELRAALREARSDSAAVAEELGDLLFTMVNLARHLKVDPEQLLRRATRKFRSRFEEMERELIARGSDLVSADLDTMEDAWQQAKRRT